MKPSVGRIRAVFSAPLPSPPNGVNRTWSGCRDLNPGPPAPKAGALPSCATSRIAQRMLVGGPGPLAQVRGLGDEEHVDQHAREPRAETIFWPVLRALGASARLAEELEAEHARVVVALDGCRGVDEALPVPPDDGSCQVRPGGGHRAGCRRHRSPPPRGAGHGTDLVGEPCRSRAQGGPKGCPPRPPGSHGQSVRPGCSTAPIRIPSVASVARFYAPSSSSSRGRAAGDTVALSRLSGRPKGRRPTLHVS